MARKTSATRSAADYLPARFSLSALRRAAVGCRGCDLYVRATQTVFGEGPPDARIVLVGETPGDEEDRQGRPFVGRAGKLLDRALNEANVDREEVYVTNVVKHFSFDERGKRRLHKKPRQVEIVACRAWIDAELLAIRPQFVVCLGATAAQTLLGKQFRLTRQRGEVVGNVAAGVDWPVAALASWHPAAILRAPTSAARAEMLDELVADLTTASKAAGRR
ncbi:MAG: uracil-DNA glycosylase [Planctomycetota bacterium]|nr:MAG: uracil-DNA glycosylase [Planctomycetota bacterium]